MAKKTTPASPRRRTTRPAPVAADTSTPPAAGPTFEQIAEEAYQRYLRRGGQHGQDFDDWVEAERALRTRK